MDYNHKFKGLGFGGGILLFFILCELIKFLKLGNDSFAIREFVPEKSLNSCVALLNASLKNG